MLQVKPSVVHKRKFDKTSGVEIEPNFSDNKKVNTGHLMSSYSKLCKSISLVHSYTNSKFCKSIGLVHYNTKYMYYRREGEQERFH